MARIVLLAWPPFAAAQRNTTTVTGVVVDGATGLQGKGLWSSHSNYAAWHLEGGPGTRQTRVKFQVRLDPLAQ